jgi:hypothetical protein
MSKKIADKKEFSLSRLACWFGKKGLKLHQLVYVAKKLFPKKDGEDQITEKVINGTMRPWLSSGKNPKYNQGLPMIALAVQEELVELANQAPEPKEKVKVAKPAAKKKTEVKVEATPVKKIVTETQVVAPEVVQQDMLVGAGQV